FSTISFRSLRCSSVSLGRFFPPLSASAARRAAGAKAPRRERPSANVSSFFILLFYFIVSFFFVNRPPATRRTDLLTICWLVGREGEGKGYKIFPARPCEPPASNTAATTASISMPFMQRKSIGHSRQRAGDNGCSAFTRRGR